MSTRGLVLREVTYKEADKILTVLTEDGGKLTVSARGARRRTSKYASSSQLLAFSEMKLYQRQGRWYLREGQTVELFDGLRRDLTLLALGSYFAELLEAASDEDCPQPEMLSLGLNSLYILSREAMEAALIKAVFELRLLCLAGYEPSLDICPKCGRPPERPRLNLRGGYVHCRACRPEGDTVSVPLDGGSLAAMSHIVSAEGRRLYAFTLGETGQRRLKDAVESYAMTQLERGFRTLEYYKGLTGGR